MEAAEEKCFFFRGSCYRFSLKARVQRLQRLLGHSRRPCQTVGRGRRFARLRYEDACFTFFSLRGNKDPDIISLICVSVCMVGSTEFSTPTSFTVHFWNT